MSSNQTRLQSSSSHCSGVKTEALADSTLLPCNPQQARWALGGAPRPAALPALHPPGLPARAWSTLRPAKGKIWAGCRGSRSKQPNSSLRLPLHLSTGDTATPTPTPSTLVVTIQGKQRQLGSPAARKLVTRPGAPAARGPGSPGNPESHPPAAGTRR